MNSTRTGEVPTVYRGSTKQRRKESVMSNSARKNKNGNDATSWAAPCEVEKGTDWLIADRFP